MGTGRGGKRDARAAGDAGRVTGSAIFAIPLFGRSFINFLREF
jgi:hypothetical protein